ncbi:MAG: winged helix-turn-helix transcriptional regulator [Gemmatimonadota bacterium]
MDDLVHAIARKHALSILNLLGARRTSRFSDIEAQLEQVGPSTLSDTLKELVSVGLVNREVYPDTPPRVEYALTEAGALLRERFHHLLDQVREG